MLLRHVWRICGEVTQPLVARLPKLRRDYSGMRDYLRLPCARLAPVAETGFSHRITAYKIVGHFFVISENIRE